METNFQQMLQIAADALSLKYSLDHAVLYWHTPENNLETIATVHLKSEEIDPTPPYAISESLMSAIRKPLLISKSDTDSPRLQIIIPLLDKNKKLGVMAFWGIPDDEFIKEADRRFLDMIGLISLRVITGLQQGTFSAEGTSVPTDQPAETQAEVDDPIEFVKVGDMEDEGGTDPFPAVSPDLELREELAEFEEEEEETAGDPELFDDAELEGLRELEEEFNGRPIELDTRLILDVTGTGFLAFDSKGNINADSPLVDPRFFKQPLEGKPALELLFEWGNPSNDDSASFDRNPKYPMIEELMQSVFSRVTDIDVLKELLPREIEVEDKCYCITYYYIKSSQMVEADNILAVFRDITREKELKASYTTEIERSNMVVKVALDVDGYYQYRRSTEKIFETIQQELEKQTPEINLELILHNIQAIQGGAELYEINEVTLLSEELINFLENKIVTYSSITREENEQLKTRINLLKDRFDFLQKHYLDYLISDEQILDKAVYRNTKSKIFKTRDRIIDDVLRKSMEELETTFEKNYKPFTRLKRLEEITQKRLNRIKGFIRHQIVEEGVKEITEIMSDLRKQPIGLMLKRYAIIAVNLGERMNKRVEVDIKGADIEVPFHTLENLFTSLTFVIRNSVEHGLESMEERIALNKSLEGNISIEAALENNILQITVADDGRGIDVDTIKQAAVKNRVIPEEEAADISDERVLQLMFTRGFSTKKDSAGTFGRGVGLSAVGAAIEELNAEVSVRTRLKQGTTIRVEIPL